MHLPHITASFFVLFFFNFGGVEDWIQGLMLARKTFTVELNPQSLSFDQGKEELLICQIAICSNQFCLLSKKYLRWSLRSRRNLIWFTVSEGSVHGRLELLLLSLWRDLTSWRKFIAEKVAHLMVQRSKKREKMKKLGFKYTFSGAPLIPYSHLASLPEAPYSTKRHLGDTSDPNCSAILLHLLFWEDIFVCSGKYCPSPSMTNHFLT